ncbi:MAG: cyclodeaminase/cyclohydrolase family protein, partial [Armatimonadetes bacterium]|nr:cyclodeaminase/cyclohydrolase family protein [Armatimonadota bacterium]
AQLAQEDMDAYEQVAKALKRPKDDPERAQALEQALRAAADVPLRALRSCLTLLRLLPELAEKGNPNLLSDVGVAAEAARCAARCAGLNVEVNLAYMKDAEYIAARRQEEQEMLDEVEHLADQVWSGVTQRIAG